jgi:hypothetical protein
LRDTIAKPGSRCGTHDLFFLISENECLTVYVDEIKDSLIRVLFAFIFLWLSILFLDEENCGE